MQTDLFKRSMSVGAKYLFATNMKSLRLKKRYRPTGNRNKFKGVRVADGLTPFNGRDYFKHESETYLLLFILKTYIAAL